MALKVFIDTEFTDFLDPYLISLGLVAETGEEFYAEVPYEDRHCSPFVREAVLPLLQNTPDVCLTIDELFIQMSNWLRLVRPSNEDILICYDYQLDWDLFVDVLDGQVPAWCRPLLVGREINELLRYEYHKKNNLPQHHALNDARANRYAYRERPPVSSQNKNT